MLWFFMFFDVCVVESYGVFLIIYDMVCFKDNMTMDQEERYFHGKPQNSFHKAVNIPDIVVYPR